MAIDIKRVLALIKLECVDGRLLLQFLSLLLENVPSDVIGGMSCLTDDLAWADDIPLWVSGT